MTFINWIIGFWAGSLLASVLAALFMLNVLGWDTESGGYAPVLMVVLLTGGILGGNWLAHRYTHRRGSTPDATEGTTP